MKPISLQQKKADWFVYGLTLFILGSILLAMVSFSLDSGKQVTVRYDNELIYTMYLDQDEEYTMRQTDFPLLLGDLVIEVKERKVRIKEETSPYHYCSQLGWVALKGMSLICAPNYVVVTIEGFYDSGFDIIPGGGGG
jgi:hypothetical protein